MYLKSLEIQGFKSFPDKISLTFDKGLTAVVGPNGSGKSNIGDSVRWVLGEQSTKTLRGNKMEDVIFSGTVARKPMGFAAVTLNIDNTDKTLPDHEEEVSITRKLYRSGDSEYIINGKQVRLKDINELFMDTGLGRDGYSIIGQGRIAEIVGAKSNERRDIFEEAAGISKFRYKKLEAERKLAGAQDNILRLSDIISELEARVEPLRIQSQKAEKFIKLAEQRKKLEISVWVRQLDDLKKKIEGIDEKLLISRMEYENVENDILKEEERIQEGYRSMQECNVKADELRQKMLEDEQTASQLKSDIAVFENDIRHCEEAVESAQKSIASLEKEKKIVIEKISLEEKNLEEIIAEKADLEEKILRLSEKLKKVRLESAQLGDSFDKTGSEINALYIKQSELKFAAESAKASVIEETARLEELKEKDSSYAVQLAEYREKITENEKKSISSAEKIKELKNKISGLEQLYKSRKDGFEEGKVLFEKALYDLKGKQQRRKILSDLENSMEGFSGSVKQVLRAAKQGRLSGIHGTVAQNISVKPEYALAVETALGGAMQNIIVDNEDIAKRCIRFLKEQKGGRGTFLPITSVKGNELHEKGLSECEGFIACANRIVEFQEKYTGIFASLLGRIVIVEDIDCGTVIAKKYGYKFRIVTLDGQVINAGGSFTGGSAQKSAGVITRRHEIETLDGEIEKLTAERDALREKAEKLRGEAEKLRYDIEGTKEQLTLSESESIRINAELESCRSLVKQMDSQNESSAWVIKDTEEKINSGMRTVEETEKSLEELDKIIRAAEADLAQGHDEREKLKVRREKMAEELSEMKLRSIELDKNRELKKAEIGALEKSVKELESGGKQHEEEIKNRRDIMISKKQDIENTREKLGNFKISADKYNEEIIRFQKMYNQHNLKVKEIQSGLKEINRTKEKLSGEVTRLEERKETAVRDNDGIIHKLLEIYELTRSEAAAIAGDITDMSQAQRELNEVKNKIRGLGNVNVEAIEEYKEVSERYKFMSEQLEDVCRSKIELEKIISGLTEEMCRIFAESFAVINRNFKEIFAELFGGGKAELILTDPDNVLESGIEISVAPPGKVIKNLISLSGGEQSFVAIAIYFAILRLRPAPFCILDEIDAALDEVNVRKYAQYLKRFTDTTQFVLVTHRRSAMEEANVLYGVTMQEDGISKLLKMEQVDFQEDAADIQ